MSICRTTIVEFHTESDADALIKDYNENYESMFPTVEIVLNSKVNPTKTINNAVFADMESIEKLIVRHDRLFWKSIKTE